MTYAVKEIYPTVQGEGYHTGREAVFVRFAGCNLWSGLERDRPDAVCTFCDTDFVGLDGPGGGKFGDAEALAHAVESAVEHRGHPGFVVLTGGEPMLQVDPPLIDALHGTGFEIAVETNGTLATPRTIDWITVSPKAEARVIQTAGDELKLVYPQASAPPERFASLAFDHFFLQPMDGPDRHLHTRRATEYCRRHPRWRLSVQTHKYLGIP